MAFEESGRERRVSLILLQYWNSLRGDNELPREDDIDPDAISVVWPHSFVLQVRDIEHVEDCNYTYLGSEILKPYEEGIINPDNKVMVSPNANHLASSYKHVIETLDPLLDEGECLGTQGQLVKFRQCMMPLAGSNGATHAILGGAWYKVFHGA